MASRDARRTGPGFATALAAALAGLLLADRSGSVGAALAPIGSAAAAGTAALLAGFGIEVARSGATLLHETGFRGQVDLACTGLPLTAIVAVALLATPTSWARRGRALAIALPLSVALHAFRLVHLVHLGITAPLSFDFAHDVVWPLALLAITATGWAYWRAQSPPYRCPIRRKRGGGLPAAA